MVHTPICRYFNYYTDMWHKRAHTPAPLTKICSTQNKFKWMGIENNAFIATKKIVGHDVLLYYPNLIKTFIIYTEAINTQLGGIFSQNGKPFF